MAKEGHYALYLSRTLFLIKTQFVSLVAFHEFPVHRRGQQLLLHPTKWSYIQLYTIFSQLNKLRLVPALSITLRESFLPRSLMSSVLPWVSFVLFYSFFFSVRYQKWNWMSWFANKLSISLSVICLLVIKKKKRLVFYVDLICHLGKKKMKIT